MYVLTKEQLLSDLYQAYKDACSHKRCKHYVTRYNVQLEANLQSLCDDLWSRTYNPYPSSCFVVDYPKKREVFAAEFRDRIVHHLYYNYTQPLYSRTFIQDSYSCLPGRGTHYGIDRLEQHIRAESRNYTRPCYVLKMDISGYFMHIDRYKLLSICLDTLGRMGKHRILSRVPVCWEDVLDMDFIGWLTREIALLDPARNCRRAGSPSDWEGLPFEKSLFNMSPGQGLPIGNLTSQLFSNVYLNVLDQWMKRQMHCTHYGRYVDDFFIVSTDKVFLLSLAPQVDAFLKRELGLSVQKGKTLLYDVRSGVPFLGAFLKKGRRYVDNKSLRHMRGKLGSLSGDLPSVPSPELCRKIGSRLNSYLGVLVHYRSYNIRRSLMRVEHDFSPYGYFTQDYRKFCPVYWGPDSIENIGR